MVGRGRVQLLPDAIVRLRRHRWRVVDVRAFDECALVTVRGIAPPVVGLERRVLTPFDAIDPVLRRTRPRRVGARRWRRACRAAIARDAPPGALRTAARAAIDLLPHQLAPALALLRGLGSRVLLADEVGLGKTIQAGLVASELLARGAIERVLVLAPAGLRDQWRDELIERFALDAVVLDARTVRVAAATLPPDVNPWSTAAVAIASIDYVKRIDILAAAAQRPWDLVIVDEAHGSASDSDRRGAVDVLCAGASYVVLVTATPHSGDPDTFLSLCRLGQIAGDRLIAFRRTRHDAGVETRRRVCTLHVRMSRAERRLHRALQRYGDAVIGLHPDAWLALSVLHKRALSSAAALAESVDRRMAVLDGRPSEGDDAQIALPFDETGETIAADEPPAWPALLTPGDGTHERRLLVNLMRAAHAASTRESKFAALERFLRRVGESVVVFTEYRDTLRHLQRAVSRSSLVLHGGLTRDQRRAVVDMFTRTPGMVLLATDAAGEGLNLHATCRLVINLELPWNPMRLEQRIGRVDRIGQERRVHAIHLVARGTRETALLSRLHERLAQARASLGAPHPLGDEERRSAEVVVLRRTLSAEPAPAGLPADVEPVSLVDECRIEELRLKAVRRVLDAEVDGTDPMETRARPSLARALANRTLELWRVVADDGRRAEEHVVALLLERDHDNVEAAIARACDEWRTEAASIAVAFASTRSRRAQALLAREDCASTTLEQPSLFLDRRRMRERLSSASERTARRAELCARVAAADAAGSLTFRAPELLLRARPRP
jgi:superfamily II DNA or RNA helicase